MSWNNNYNQNYRGSGRGQQNQQWDNQGYGQQQQQYGQNNPYAQNPYAQQQQQYGGQEGSENYGYPQQQGYGGFPQQQGQYYNQGYGQPNPYQQGYNNNQFNNQNQYQEPQQPQRNTNNNSRSRSSRHRGRNQDNRQNDNRGRRNNQRSQNGFQQEETVRVMSKADPTKALNAVQERAAQPEPVPQPQVSVEPEIAVPVPAPNEWDDESDNEPSPVSDLNTAAVPQPGPPQPGPPALEEDVNAPKPPAENASEEPAPDAEPEILEEIAVPEPEPAAPAPSKKKKKQKKPKAKRHDPREHLNLVFIGHVDAGKSTLSGQILLKTGQVDERTVMKYEREAKEKNRESWWIAYIMDTSEEERAKGKTVECGRAHFETEKKRYTILDAPGHKNYVPHMISGAAQADVACLVISCRVGEFEAGFNRGGQTREHANLAYTLGIKRMLIVMNKLDCVDWSEERYNDILSRLEPFLKSCGYKWKDVVVVPVSGQMGVNISERIDTEAIPEASWFEGPCLLEALDGLKKMKRDKKKPLRIPVMDRYKDMGCIMAIGKVEANRIQVGDKVTVAPSGKVGTVVQILVDEEQVEMASTGENVVVGLKGLTYDDIHGGCVLCDLENVCPRANTIEVQMQILDLLEHKPIFSVGYSAIFHIHNVAVEFEVIAIPHKLQKKTGRRSARPPPFLKNGDPAIVRLAMKKHCCVETFDTYQQLGRFSVRDEGKTIAIGKVLALID